MKPPLLQSDPTTFSETHPRAEAYQGVRFAFFTGEF
jgi:hypothetical protein